MARTGPQKIPGASQAYFYGTGQYSGSDMEVNCGVVHTTEGRSLPSYNGGAMAPTVTGVPDIKAKRIRWYQHYDVDESARALANKLGGVQTNTANVFQIELVGTCDDTKRTTWDGKRAGVDYIHWPTAPDWALAEVAWLVRWLHDYHKVPLTCVKDWLAYGKDARRPGVMPASYGASPARMTFDEWRAFKGWCGHQHVPENDHGDPGSMDFARVLEHANGRSAPTTPTTSPAPAEEDDVPSMLDTNNPVDAALSGGEWTPLALPAQGGTILTGPRHYSVGVHLSLTGLQPGALVEARFHRVMGSTRSDRRPQRAYAAADGTVEARFTDAGTLDDGETLRLDVRPADDCTLIHRAINGPHWAG